MLALRDLQRKFAGALVSGDAGALAAHVEAGAISPVDRFDVYRANREGALVNALKLTYPAVEALVGEAFFASAAREHIRHLSPTSALLTLYGATFPVFLASHPQATNLPYLADVARLEWSVSQISQESGGYSEKKFPVGAVAMALSTSLTLLTLRYRAAAIWRAALDGDEAELSRIILDPSPTAVAIWRVGMGADVVELSATAAAFVEGLLTHGDVTNALMKAAAHAPDPTPMITDEVLRADFVRLEPISTF